MAMDDRKINVELKKLILDQLNAQDTRVKIERTIEKTIVPQETNEPKAETQTPLTEPISEKAVKEESLEKTLETSNEETEETPKKKKRIKKVKVKKEKKDKKERKRKVLVTITSVINVIVAACFFFAYGPVSFLRDWLVTTALSTGTHQYFAQILYNNKMIEEVVKNNTISEPSEIMDQSAISIGNLEIPTSFSSIYEQQVLDREPDALYKMVELDENGYEGYVVFVYDPTRISLVTSSRLGTGGEFLSTMAKRAGAVVAINGGGHGYAGNKEWPSGYVYKNGKIVYKHNRSSKWGGGTIGFTKEGVLILTKSEGQAALDEGIYNGVDFGPFLIVNGVSSKISGNGGYGNQPRSCIGQRKDGIVILLVIEGRSASSTGITLDKVVEIFERYEAYNAANLDGGGSSALIINNKLINNPSGFGYSGERYIQTGWIVK